MGFGDVQLFKKVVRAFDKEKGKLFKFNTNKSYIYATCKHCDARVCLKRQEGVSGFRVFKFNNQHVHRVSGVKAEQEKEIAMFLDRKGYTFTTKGIEAILQDQFGISHRRFLYLRQKKEETSFSLEEYLVDLKLKESVLIGPWLEN